VANIKSQSRRNKQNVVRPRAQQEGQVRGAHPREERRRRRRHEDEESALRLAIKRIDKAATKKIIHKNQAANKKSG